MEPDLKRTLLDSILTLKTRTSLKMLMALMMVWQRKAAHMKTPKTSLAAAFGKAPINSLARKLPHYTKVYFGAPMSKVKSNLSFLSVEI